MASLENAGMLEFHGDFYGSVLFYWWGMMIFLSGMAWVTRKFIVHGIL